MTGTVEPPTTSTAPNVKWKAKYHERFKTYVETGKTYRTLNKHDDPQFDQNNKAMLHMAKLLNNVGGIEFSEYQLDLTSTILPFTTKQMYDKWWIMYKTSIMKLYKIPKQTLQPHQIISTTARREGKTSFYRNLAIAIALACPTEHGLELRIALPAHREKTSRESMFKLKQALFNVPGFLDPNQYIILEENVDVIRFRRPNSKGFVEIRAFAGDNVSPFLIQRHTPSKCS